MKSPKTMAYAVAAATAATLLLAGCNGGDDDPTPTPSPTSSSTQSPSPSGSATPTANPSSPSTTTLPMPQAAKAHTEDGAEEFAKFYALAADAAYVSGDPAQLNSSGADDCVGCIALEEGVKAQSADGTKQVSPAVQVVRAVAAVPPEPNPDLYYVDVSMVVREVEVKDPAGNVVSTTTAGKPIWRVTVTWISGGWNVSAVESL